MNTEQFLGNLWEELDEKQAENLSGGVKNPGGKEFDELPGKGHIKGKGKRNWDFGAPAPAPSAAPAAPAAPAPPAWGGFGGPAGPGGFGTDFSA